MTALARTFDVVRAQEFTERAMLALSAAATASACAIGDRLGLFADLEENGPATAAQLAARTGLDERCVRGWLRALGAAAYLDYDPASEAFALPPEHAPLLAHEGGATFMGGGFQLLAAFGKAIDKVAGAFLTGAGVPQSEYDDDLSVGMERMSAPSFDHALVQQWLAAAHRARALLEGGARVADVGCGGGRALIALAKAFPSSSFTGYDVFAPALSRARASAVRAGVDDRVRFVQHDVAHGFPDGVDLITVFNALHDVADPAAVLASIRAALSKRGTALILESATAERFEDDINPYAAILHGTSLMYSIPVSIANGGPGTGAASLPESTLRPLCARAGLALCRLPIANPFFALYEAMPG